VCFTVRAGSQRAAEVALADALEAGVSGLEERDAQDEGEVRGGTTWLLYAPEAAAAAVAAVLEQAPGLEFSGPTRVAPEDWAETWKQGLEAVVVSPRLRVRPSVVAAPAVEGQAEVVIDPGQAFGTGGHLSTLLALEWVAALADAALAEACVLDVGSGSGVLALAALRLGARGAVAFDLDPLAGQATRDNAAANDLAARLSVFVGPVSALGAVRFDVVLANLLSSELLPVLRDVARLTAAGGSVVLSGLLAAEEPRIVQECGRVGLRREGRRARSDANGDDWVSLLMRSRPTASGRLS